MSFNCCFYKTYLLADDNSCLYCLLVTYLVLCNSDSVSTEFKCLKPILKIDLLSLFSQPQADVQGGGPRGEEPHLWDTSRVDLNLWTCGGDNIWLGQKLTFVSLNLGLIKNLGL